ncbi:unnamed protein product [Adineta steineri]|uniref:Uncharacterized protein n=1 Tax=Adineta steineri TaxID=433720 RepID=A0A814X280_9BILA|nr:unnamed protein product [Adineta steineri]
MSYLRRKPEDEIWYVHSPLKKGNRELVTAPPPSQIPYLNGVFDDEATLNQPKVMYVRDTDTDYIRRCKLGISQNFLNHVDPATRKSKEPVPYPRPLWWDGLCEHSSTDADGDSQQEGASTQPKQALGPPAWFVHREHKPSPDRRQEVPSKQYDLPTKSKKK